MNKETRALIEARVKLFGAQLARLLKGPDGPKLIRIEVWIDDIVIRDVAQNLDHRYTWLKGERVVIDSFIVPDSLVQEGLAVLNGNQRKMVEVLHKNGRSMLDTEFPGMDTWTVARGANAKLRQAGLLLKVVEENLGFTNKREVYSYRLAKLKPPVKRRR